MAKGAALNESFGQLKCTGCGKPLSENLISTIINQPMATRWVREGYCSLICFKHHTQSTANKHIPQPTKKNSQSHVSTETELEKKPADTSQGKKASKISFEGIIRCSVCEKYVKENDNECPNCGSKFNDQIIIEKVPIKLNWSRIFVAAGIGWIFVFFISMLKFKLVGLSLFLSPVIGGFIVSIGVRKQRVLQSGLSGLAMTFMFILFQLLTGGIGISPVLLLLSFVFSFVFGAIGGEIGKILKKD